ncbi:MAG: type II toxin-antitoxin system Phd/YefM family antitoxin [Chloroflexi bacterium]|nr:MAG: type II toxin-antitoxin system Phd/YefM family antitoxin [Chloroflexota bacterium]
MHIPQIEPVTSLSNDYKSIISKLANGPVILAEQNRSAAVLLSVSEYERMSSRLDHLELLREAKRNLAKAALHPDTTISHNDLKQLCGLSGFH